MILSSTNSFNSDESLGILWNIFQMFHQNSLLIFSQILKNRLLPFNQIFYWQISLQFLSI